MGAFSHHRNGFGYSARTDTKTNIIHEAAWVRVPYPGLVITFMILFILILLKYFFSDFVIGRLFILIFKCIIMFLMNEISNL